MLCAAQKVTKFLCLTYWKDCQNILYRTLRDNPDSFEVAKYFIKSSIDVSTEPDFIDLNWGYKCFLLGEEELKNDLIEKLNYTKLNTKLKCMKLKKFSKFMNDIEIEEMIESFKKLESIKNEESIRIMTTLAIHYLKKSKFDEARAYISKSFELINQLYGPD